MSRQWQGLLQNLGQWQGSFTQLSPTGAILADTPSQVTLTLSDDAHTIDFCLQRFPVNAPAQETHLRFTYPGPGRHVPFLPGGAFSQGTLQWSPVSRCGAELALIWGDRRLRLVLQFEAASAELSHLTLIREHRAHTGAGASPPLRVSDLVGNWQGEAETYYADGREPEATPTQVKVEAAHGNLSQTLTFGAQTLHTTGQIAGACIHFEGGSLSKTLLLLPGGASSLFPQSIPASQPFFLEAGWLIAANLRQRLIRSYNDRGEWVSLTLVTERRIA